MSVRKLRFSLGRKEDTTDLVTNGDFSSGLTGWNQAGGWANVGNTAEITVGGGVILIKYLEQTGIFTLGKVYKVKFDVTTATTGNTGMGVVVGDRYRDIDEYTVASDYEVIRRCIEDNDLRFHSDYVGLDNVRAYEMIWNDPLDDEPFGWTTDDWKARIMRTNDHSEIQIDEFTGQVTFHGDGYEYLRDLWDDGNYCEEVPLRIEVYNGSSWDVDIERSVFLTDAEWDLESKQVTLNVENPFISAIKDAEDQKMYIRNGTSTFDIDIPFEAVNIDFNNAAGAYPGGGYQIGGYRLLPFLQSIPLYVTNMKLSFSSNYFDNGGTHENDCLVAGINIRTSTAFTYGGLDLAKSWAEMFRELSNMHMLTWYVDLDANNVPTVYMEKREDTFDSTTVITLTNITNLKESSNIDNLFRTIEIGYAKKEDENEDGKKSSFYLGGQYVTESPCLEQAKDALVKDLVQDPSVIRHLLDGSSTNTDFDSDVFYVEVDGSDQSKNSGSGSYPYNPNIDPEDLAARWVWEALSDLVLLIEVPVEITKSNDPHIFIYTFEAVITEAQRKELFLNPFGVISFNTSCLGGAKTGWILDMEYSWRTGIASFKVLTT